MTIEELSWFVDDTVIRKLQGIKGVARVDRYGGVTREIKVEVDPDRLTALGVTAGDVNRALRAVNLDTTGGNGDFGERDQSIRTLGGARRIADLEALEIPLPGGRKARLSDIATVTDSFAEPASFARLNNQTIVSFGIFRGKGESDVDVRRRVEAGRRRAAKRRIRGPPSPRWTIRFPTPRATTIRRWRRWSRAPCSR